jgi:hypothetical protein
MAPLLSLGISPVTPWPGKMGQEQLRHAGKNRVALGKPPNCVSSSVVASAAAVETSKEEHGPSLKEGPRSSKESFFDQFQRVMALWWSWLLLAVYLLYLLYQKASQLAILLFGLDYSIVFAFSSF